VAFVGAEKFSEIYITLRTERPCELEKKRGTRRGGGGLRKEEG